MNPRPLPPLTAIFYGSLKSNISFVCVFFFSFMCVYACMFVPVYCLCTQVYANVYVYTCVSQTEVNLECHSSGSVCLSIFDTQYLYQRLSIFLILWPFNTVPHTVTPTIELFHCYTITLICHCYEF